LKILENDEIIWAMQWSAYAFAGQGCMQLVKVKLLSYVVQAAHSNNGITLPQGRWPAQNTDKHLL